MTIKGKELIEWLDLLAYSDCMGCKGIRLFIFVGFILACSVNAYFLFKIMGKL